MYIQSNKFRENHAFVGGGIPSTTLLKFFRRRQVLLLLWESGDQRVIDVRPMSREKFETLETE